MARRVGIELSESRCALVDLELRARGTTPVAAAVRTFRTIPWSPDHAHAFVATLRLLRKAGIVPARAVVALWGLPSTCDHFSLLAGDDRRLRAQALRELRMTGRLGPADTVSAVLVDRVGRQASPVTRDVTVVSAPAAEVRARLAPLTAADFAIEAVITPAMALASLARLLPGGDDDGLRAYIAVNAEATAVAIVEKGLLVHAREIALPLRAGRPGPEAEATGTLDVVDFVRRLAPELRRSFLALRQQSKGDVRQVVICGELRDLRALTAPLTTALQVEVATLDVLQGLASGVDRSVDADVLDQAGALRVAWAAAAAGSSAVTLLPAPGTARAAWRRPLSRFVTRAAAAMVLLAAVVLAGRAMWMRAHSGDGGGRRDTTPRVEARRPEPAVPAAATSVQAAPSPGAAASRPVQQGQRSQARPVTPAVEQSPADPVIDSILYGPDRRLALIDHRIVRVGDRVEAGVIADIEPNAVVVRRPSGELRRIAMKGALK